MVEPENKTLISVTADTKLALLAYNPDVATKFDLVTNAETVIYLFNHSSYMLAKYGKCTNLLKAYALAKCLDEEEIEAVICETFFETPAETRKKEKLILLIERRE